MKDKTYKTIAITKIKPKADQPRTFFDEEKIQELASSIKENGLLQPITVYKKNNGFEIVAGERRYRACMSLGMKDIPCLITRYTEEEVDVLSIIENIQREDLSVIEEAKAYQKLLITYGYTQSQLAASVGKKQSTIANKIRLLNLQEPVQLALDKKEITERHARALLSVSPDKQANVLTTIIEKGYNVAQTEEYLKPKEPKQKIIKPKLITRNMKIAINTILQSVKMVEQSGSTIDCQQTDTQEETILTIRIKNK